MQRKSESLVSVSNIFCHHMFQITKEYMLVWKTRHLKMATF